MDFKIDDKTSIPLFAVLAAAPVMVGFIIWLSTIYSIASNAQQVNESQDRKIESSSKILVDIRERLIRIETKLDNRK